MRRVMLLAFLALALPTAALASDLDLFVTNVLGNLGDPGVVGKYTTSGATVYAGLISGLSGPNGIAISGSHLFVTNYFGGTIGEYTTSGKTVNVALISGLRNNQFMALASSPIPEPGTLSLLGTGLIGLAGLATRKLKL